MRVAIVSRIYRPEPSAASMFLGAVSDALTSHGHEVDVLTARAPQERTDAHEGESVRSFPVLRDAQGYVRGYFQYLSFDIPLAFRLLFLRRPDVIFMEPPPTTGVVVRIVSAIRRIPYVYDAADIWSDAAALATGSGLVIRVLRIMERFAMRGASRLVTISSGVVARARVLGVTREITVTGFGADTRAFTPSENTQPSRLFVYAGSYSAWHGADILIDAFARVLDTHPQHRLRFIGNGSDRESLERRAAELGIRDSVDFLETLPEDQLLPHLHAAVASLATLRPGTQYEYAFTTKAYSSMAAGCPVVFAGPGPTGPFVAEAGDRVRGGLACAYSVDAIAAAMAEYADDPLGADERLALGSWIAREHSLIAVANRVADAIAQASRGKR